VIIVAVAVVALAGFGLWGLSVNRHDPARTKAATAELRAAYRDVDVTALQHAFVRSASTGNPTHIAGLPTTT
jgi:hypothetical protein